MDEKGLCQDSHVGNTGGRVTYLPISHLPTAGCLQVNPEESPCMMSAPSFPFALGDCGGVVRELARFIFSQGQRAEGAEGTWVQNEPFISSSESRRPTLPCIPPYFSGWLPQGKGRSDDRHVY